ncbi:MAG TPA: acetyl-CoA carboxylase biotin carboxyl carrier protein subunit [Thermoleophilaceae bacterium]|nr:acetyl-CoA carboxylase biotin carboxyl carrier protein subunit [Thermoleophilaceae bacterium]
MDVAAHITGMIWQINVAVGDSVEEGDEVIVLESMKMEMPLEAEISGTVDKVTCTEGDRVSEGDILLVLRDD